VSDDPLEDRPPPQPTRAIIGQITHHLDHMAEMLYAIDDKEANNHLRRTAFVDSFLLDFRALYYFLLDKRRDNDAHRYDFVDIKTWQRPKTDATKRMHKLVLFISKYRAHLSMSRFVPEYQELEDLLGVRRISAEFLGGVLLDFLEILDDFIDKLPEGKESGKAAWIGAAYNARYKTEVALGVRESDYPDSLQPLKSVQKLDLALTRADA
jgi:hypothetical protein